MAAAIHKPHTPSSDPVYEDDESRPEDEPILGGLRSLSVSEASDTTVESIDEAVTPPESPCMDDQRTIDKAMSGKRQRGSDFGLDIERPHDAPFMNTPDAPTPSEPSFFALTPPPSSAENCSAKFAVTGIPESPSPSPTVTLKGCSPGLAARRAASGKLPSKALISLQQMRFEASSNAGEGLGVGPGSAGFESLDVTPGSTPHLGTSMAFRLALGLEGGKKGAFNSSAPSSPGEENFFSVSPTTADSSHLHSPSLGSFNRGNGSPTSRNRRQFPRSPKTSSQEEVKIPPSLRGSKILDKLKLVVPPPLNSPLGTSPRDFRFSGVNGPPSPLIQRTSAFAYTNQGPLTPLTPSHVPGAPNLSGGSAFDWFNYSIPESPSSTPSSSSPSNRSFGGSGGVISEDQLSSPQRTLFWPSSPSSEVSGKLPRLLSASPLGNERTKPSSNPFFTYA